MGEAQYLAIFIFIKLALYYNTRKGYTVTGIKERHPWEHSRERVQPREWAQPLVLAEA